MKNEEHILAVVIGGIKTNIAVMRVKKGGFDVVFHLDYSTMKIWGFNDLIENTIQVARTNAGIKIRTACIAGAGELSIERDKLQLEVMDLQISSEQLVAKTSLRKVYLLNDFEAMIYGISHLRPDIDYIKLPHVKFALTPHKLDEATIAVIGIHHTLGMAIGRYEHGLKHHVAYKSSGEGMDLVARNKVEQGLIDYLKKRMTGKSHPSYSNVLSLQGVGLVFNYMATKRKGNGIVKTVQKLKGAEKLAAIQSNYHSNTVCRMTMDLMISCYGRASRNLALVSECYSGLWLSNVGVLKNIKNMEDKNRMLQLFMEEFVEHDSFSTVLSKIPVYILLNKNTVLYGCVHYTTL